MKCILGVVGPVSVAINANYIKQYHGGIFNDSSCVGQLNHGVLAVGYGSENHHDYWIVKNSWGTTWGDRGYIKMARNNLNQCGIASKSSFPIIE